jgi:hypothetical protein
MAGKPVELVVLKDLQGDYYLLPREALEQTKVPDEYRGEVEKMLETAAPTEGELSDDQLEAVAGGVGSLGFVQAPSRLSFDGIQRVWSSAGQQKNTQTL